MKNQVNSFIVRSGTPQNSEFHAQARGSNTQCQEASADEETRSRSQSMEHSRSSTTQNITFYTQARSSNVLCKETSAKEESRSRSQSMEHSRSGTPQNSEFHTQAQRSNARYEEDNVDDESRSSSRSMEDSSYDESGSYDSQSYGRQDQEEDVRVIQRFIRDVEDFFRQEGCEVPPLHFIHPHKRLPTRKPEQLSPRDNRFGPKSERIFICDGCGNAVQFSSKQKNTQYFRVQCDFAGSWSDNTWSRLPYTFYRRAWEERLIDATWYCSEICNAPVTGGNQANRLQRGGNWKDNNWKYGKWRNNNWNYHRPR